MRLHQKFVRESSTAALRTVSGSAFNGQVAKIKGSVPGLGGHSYGLVWLSDVLRTIGVERIA
jgi:hypothetical protein